MAPSCVSREQVGFQLPKAPLQTLLCAVQTAQPQHPCSNPYFNLTKSVVFKRAQGLDDLAMNTGSLTIDLGTSDELLYFI